MHVLRMYYNRDGKQEREEWNEKVMYMFVNLRSACYICYLRA